MGELFIFIGMCLLGAFCVIGLIEWVKSVRDAIIAAVKRPEKYRLSHGRYCRWFLRSVWVLLSERCRKVRFSETLITQLYFRQCLCYHSTKLLVIM